MANVKIHAYEMRAVHEPLVKTERESDPLSSDSVLVKVHACGVCHTDLGFLYDGVPTRHALPLVLGHEISGTIVDAGNNVQSWLHKKVVIPAVIPCGTCRLCQSGRGDICKKQIFPGNDVHGGFASHVVVPARGLCEVGNATLDNDSFARLSVCADAVSTAYQAVLRSHVAQGDFAIFIGVGGVGGFGVQVARAMGAKVLAIDVDDDRLQSIQANGAEWILNVRGMSSKEVRSTVRELAKKNALASECWKIFETSGTTVGQETAFSLLTYGAVLGVVGYTPKDVTVRLSNLMAFAAEAVGTWGCLPEHYTAVLQLIADGKVNLNPFVEFHPMSSINEVFEALRNHKMKKRPVLIPDFM